MAVVRLKPNMLFLGSRFIFPRVSLYVQECRHMVHCALIHVVSILTLGGKKKVCIKRRDLHISQYTYECIRFLASVAFGIGFIGKLITALCFSHHCKSLWHLILFHPTQVSSSSSLVEVKIPAQYSQGPKYTPEEGELSTSLEVQEISTKISLLLFSLQAHLFPLIDCREKALIVVQWQ